ncbi:MAG: F0F1 ATP synthase subunit gamma [Geminicoccaceae bacterium]|nr:MAG: F0F1 ATP synthase subunit gamma [Geminicoccaceae bacterium]
MPSLKDLRNRINSVKQTRKITSAMKLVASSKLKRAQEQAEQARPFAERMSAMLANLGAAVRDMPEAPPLLAGTGKDEVHLLIVATADKGLCGGFNSSIARGARRRVQALRADGKQVKIICVGRKGRDLLRRDLGDLIEAYVGDVVSKKKLEYADAEKIATMVTDRFEAGTIDSCSIVYNRFKSVISSELTFKPLVPVDLPEATEAAVEDNEAKALYTFEPEEEVILQRLLPTNLAVQIYRALLENAASEQGARMAAMDSATRNAGEMIKKLTLSYNRQRQAAITKELIEIVSGAEAV